MRDLTGRRAKGRVSAEGTPDEVGEVRAGCRSVDDWGEYEMDEDEAQGQEVIGVWVRA